MHLQVKHQLLAVVVILLLPLSSFAVDDKKDKPGQKNDATTEDSVGIYDQENKVSEDFFMLPEVTTPNKTTVTQEKRNYTSYEPKTASAEKAEAEGANDAAMSFNIIYYIIDKFKFTDPLD